MATRIDGKQTSSDIRIEIAKKVKSIKEQGGKIPHLAAILVGNDGQIGKWSSEHERNLSAAEWAVVKLREELRGPVPGSRNQEQGMPPAILIVPGEFKFEQNLYIRTIF